MKGEVGGKTNKQDKTWQAPHRGPAAHDLGNLWLTADARRICYLEIVSFGGKAISETAEKVLESCTTYDVDRVGKYQEQLFFKINHLLKYNRHTKKCQSQKSACCIVPFI